MKEKYKLIITFSEYAGNFHREFNAFVLGFENECCHEHVENLVSEFTNNLPEEGWDDVDQFYDEWQCDCLDTFYDEYGLNVSELAHGNKIIVHFQRRLGKFMELVLKRLKQFPERMKKLKEETEFFGDTNLKILKVELKKETITETTTEIKL